MRVTEQPIILLVDSILSQEVVHKKEKANFSKKYFLHELLPYNLENKIKAELRNSLNDYLTLISISFEALKAFTNNEFRKFDALVGENACQIRAVLVAISASKNLINLEKLLKKIQFLTDKISSLLIEKSINNLMSVQISLKDLIQSKDLNFDLSFYEIYLILSFILTESKVCIIDKEQEFSLTLNEKCDPKKLKKFGSITSNFAQNLVRKSRKILAALSVQYLRKISSKLSDQCLKKMLSNKFTFKQNNHLLSAPMFWSYKCLLSSIKNEKIYIGIHAKFVQMGGRNPSVIDEEYLIFQNTCDENFNLVLPEKISKVDYSKPIIIFQGVVCITEDTIFSKEGWEKKLLRYPLETIILAAAADHRQYLNTENNATIDSLDDYEYLSHKLLAKHAGFSSVNPSILFIQHVYVTNISSALKL